MFKKILKWCNENHWFLIAGGVIICGLLWSYGCNSTTHSMINDNQLVTRSELKAELEYYVSLAKARAEELDQQDAIKQQLLDAANIMSTTGTINPSGLLNLIASVGGISFGLNRNQKVKALQKQITENVKATDTA
jgi:hypothetical protein